MTIAQHARTIRFGLAILLYAAWAYGVVQWIGHPNGASAMLVGLIGFALFGVAAWIAPIEQRSLRTTIRAFGTIVGVVALALFAWLLLLLRNGL
jgi:hypothetical protein